MLFWGAEAVVHDVFYFMVFTLFVFIQAFRVFYSYHLCEQASLSELVCAGAWAAFSLSSLCTHYMCVSMGMKVCRVAFLPLSSPGVVLTLLHPVVQFTFHGSETSTLTVSTLARRIISTLILILILWGTAVPERVNLMALSPWRKNPFVAEKEREREKRGREGMRNHPSARRNPLSDHVFPLGSHGWRGCYASNRTLMAEALKKSC